MFALGLLLALAASDPAAASGRTVTWSFGGVSHSLRVRPDKDDLALQDRDHAWLRSVVGPMMSTLHHRTMGEYHSLQVRTEYQGQYQFDLIGWLDESGQSGSAILQLLTGPACRLKGSCEPRYFAWSDRPHCPSPKAVAAWDGGFVELAGMLVSAECVTDEAIGVEPGAFWVDNYDGGTVTLAVAREHCEQQPRTCNGVVSYISVAPPEDWKPWLEAAQAGRGYLPKLAPVKK